MTAMPRQGSGRPRPATDARSATAPRWRVPNQRLVIIIPSGAHCALLAGLGAEPRKACFYTPRGSGAGWVCAVSDFGDINHTAMVFAPCVSDAGRKRPAVSYSMETRAAGDAGNAVAEKYCGRLRPLPLSLAQRTDAGRDRREAGEPRRGGGPPRPQARGGGPRAQDAAREPRRADCAPPTKRAAAQAGRCHKGMNIFKATIAAKGGLPFMARAAMVRRWPPPASGAMEPPKTR